MKNFWKQWKKQILCIVSALILFLVMELKTGAGEGEGIMFLSRKSYGEGESSYQVAVEGLSESPAFMDIWLQDRVYSDEESARVFSEIYENIDGYILGENKKLDEVRTNLNLTTYLSEYGVRIRWSSDNPEYLDSFGEVYPLPQGMESANVNLDMELSDGVHKQSYKVEVRVVPPILSKEEEAMAGLYSVLKKLDESKRTEDGIWLPKEYDGKKLYYRDQERTDHKILLVLGIILAGLCYAKDEADKKERFKKRNQQMLLDYSEIVSKLMVFFGAGMTVLMAWERIVRDYEAVLKKHSGATRFAYEEMCHTYYQLKSGTPEGQAYREFGGRCRLQPYRKLASLLEQNRKNGMKNLRSLMEIEMADAFEQRKNTARRLGEEAATKLLLPLFFMLAVVMVMIVMPAFLAFY